MLRTDRLLNEWTVQLTVFTLLGLVLLVFENDAICFVSNLDMHRATSHEWSSADGF